MRATSPHPSHLIARAASCLPGLLFLTAYTCKSYVFARGVRAPLHRPAVLLSILVSALLASLAYSLAIRTQAILLGLSSLLFTVILNVNLLYWRSFHEFLSLGEVTHAWQIAPFAGLIWTLSRRADLLLYADLPAWLLLAHWARHLARPAFARWRVGLLSFALLFSVILGTYQVNSSFSHFLGANNLRVLRYYGFCHYVVKDAYWLLRATWFRFDLPARDAAEIAARLARLRAARPALPSSFGIAKGMNVITIQVESLHAAAIGLEVAGQEIMPSLNKLAKEGLVWNNCYSVVFAGMTSDAEFSAINSMLPMQGKSLAYAYSYNDYFGLAALLRQAAGYHTMAFASSEPAFWNMRRLHRAYGFSQTYYAEDLRGGREQFEDYEFLEAVAPRLASAKTPFFAHILTLSSHAPFNIPADERHALALKVKEGLFRDYLVSLRYVDKSIGQFISRLSDSGVLARTVVVIWGDHEPSLPSEDRSELLRYSRSALDEKVFGRIPLIVWLPRSLMVSGVFAEEVSLMDVAPTVAELVGVSTAQTCFLGRNLFDRVALRAVPVNGGGFLIDGQYVEGTEEFQREGVMESFALRDGAERGADPRNTVLSRGRELRSVSEAIIRWNLVSRLKGISPNSSVSGHEGGREK